MGIKITNTTNQNARTLLDVGNNNLEPQVAGELDVFIENKLEVAGDLIVDGTITDSDGNPLGGSNLTAQAPISIVSDEIQLDQSGIEIGQGQVTDLTDDLAAKLAASTTLATTAPLNGGGNLADSLTLGISAASGSNAGSFSASDYTKLTNATDAATNSTLALRNVSGNISISAPSSGSHATTKTYVDNLAATKLTYSQVWLINDSSITPFAQASDTNAARGAALRLAVAAAVSGDTVLLFAGIFDLSLATQLELELPAGVTLAGSGWGTIIRSNAGSATLDNKCTINLNDDCICRDFYLENTLPNTTSLPIGRSGPGTFNRAILDNVKVTAASDCFYIWAGNGCSATLKNCYFVSKYDCVALLNSNNGIDTITAYNCVFETNGAALSDQSAGTRSNVTNKSQNFYAENCRFICSNTASNTLCVNVHYLSTASAAARTELVDCWFSSTASAGTVCNVSRASSSSGLITVVGGKGSGTDSAIIKGSNPSGITIQNNLANTTITATTPIQIAGTTSATLGQDRTISILTASTSQTGALSNTDWDTFNNKVATSRTLTGTAPILIDGGSSGDLSANRTISISASSGSNAGTQSAAHFTLVNNATSGNTPSTIAKRDSNSEISVGTPTNGNSATSKSYVDGLIDSRITKVVKCASTASIVSFSGTTTIDGISLIAGDRLLIKNQSGGFQHLNGIWLIQSGSWTRPTDWDSIADVPGRCLVLVSQGTVSGGVIYQLDQTSMDVGTDNATFTKSLPYAAGTGLTLNNSTKTFTFDGSAATGIPESGVTNLTTDLAAKVATSRTLNTTSPITGGGDLSADRTLAINTASNSQAGVISSAKHTEFSSRVLSMMAYGPTEDAAVVTGLASGPSFYVTPELNGFVLTSIHARNTTAGVTGSSTYQIVKNRSGSPTNMLSTAMNIETGETGTDTSAIPGTIDVTAGVATLATGDIISIDVLTVSTTKAKGLEVSLGLRSS